MVVLFYLDLEAVVCYLLILGTIETLPGQYNSFISNYYELLCIHVIRMFDMFLKTFLVNLRQN